MITYEKLYQYDNNDRLRVWWMEQSDDSYRTVSGLDDGVKVESGWKKALPKNIGKANATTGQQQAEAEIASQYQKKIDKGFSKEIPDINAESKFFQPMLAAKYQDVTISFPIFCQPKLDGVRCIVNKHGMWSRNGKPIVSCPHIFEELKPIFAAESAQDIVLDGELYNHDLKHDFNKIISLVKKIKPTLIDLAETAQLAQYHIYDVYMNDYEFSVRNSAISMMFTRSDIKWNMVKKVDTAYVTNQETLDLIYAKYLEDGYEGQMCRNNTPYENKRTKNLIKRKEGVDAEFIVKDILPGTGNWAGIAKKVILQITPEIVCEAGIRGNQVYLKQVLEEKHLFVGNPAKTWYQNLTPEGKLRFGIVLELNRTM